MEAREKAHQLVNRFASMTTKYKMSLGSTPIPHAIESAHLVVDEILMVKSKIYERWAIAAGTYWQEVKNELTKMK